MPNVAPETRRGVWAALEDCRPHTLDEIETVTALDPMDVLLYVEQLICNEFVVFSGVKRARSGEVLPILKLVNRPGPEPPDLDPEPEPNPEFADAAEGRPASRNAMIRRILRELGDSFDLVDAREAVLRWACSTPNRTVSGNTWNQIKHTQLEPAANQFGQYGKWRLKPAPDVDAIVAWFTRPENQGRIVRLAEIRKALGLRIHPARMRRALEDLTAMGFRVSRFPHARGGGKIDYRVDPQAILLT